MPLLKMWISFNAFLEEKKNLNGKYSGEIRFWSCKSNQVQFFQLKKRFIYQNKTLFVFYYPEVLKNQTDS